MNIASLLKFKKDRTASWWIFLVFIVIIFVLGILVIINPEALAKIVVRLEGATLVFNTLVTLILTYKVNKMLKEVNKLEIIETK